MIGTIIKHYIFDIGLNAMFDNINNNFNISKSKHKIHFAQELNVGFKCSVCVTYDGENAYWYDDMICTEIGLIGCAFKCKSGISIRPLYEQIMSIIVIDEFGDEEGEEYMNDICTRVYTDSDGNIRDSETNEIIDMDDSKLINNNGFINK